MNVLVRNAPLFAVAVFLALFMLASGHFRTSLGLTSTETRQLLPAAPETFAHCPAPRTAQPSPGPLGPLLYQLLGKEPGRTRLVTAWGILLAFLLTALALARMRPEEAWGNSPRTLPGGALTLAGGALLVTHFFLLTLGGMALPAYALAAVLSAALSGFALRSTPDWSWRHLAAAACLLLALAALPILLGPLAALWLATLPVKRRLPSLAVAAIALLLPLVVRMLFLGDASLLEAVLLGAPAGGGGLGAWLLDSLAQAPTAVLEGSLFLLLAYGQPLRLVGDFLALGSHAFNPVSLLVGAALLLHPLAAAVAGRWFPAASTQRHRILLLLLVGIVGALLAAPRSPDVVGLALALYPLLLLSLLVDLARLPRLRPLGNRSLLIFLLPLALTAQAVDLFVGVRAFADRPPARHLKVQQWLVETVDALHQDAAKRSAGEGDACLYVIARESQGLFELSGARTRTCAGREEASEPDLALPPRNCRVITLVLETDLNRPVANATTACRNQLALAGFNADTLRGDFLAHEALAVGKEAVPAYCVWQWTRLAGGVEVEAGVK